MPVTRLSKEKGKVDGEEAEATSTLIKPRTSAVDGSRDQCPMLEARG